MKIRNAVPFGNKGDPIEAAKAEADSTLFQRVDSAQMQARPNTAPTYKELELDRTAEEQQELFIAEGIAQSRQPHQEAAGLEVQVAAAKEVLAVQRVLVEQASRRLLATLEALAPYRVRGSKATWFYYARTLAFLIGDIAGISGAALMLGETYANSYILSLSAATATVVAGLVGKELKVIQGRLRRRRELDSLTEAERPFAHLFTGTIPGTTVVLCLLLASLLTAGLVAIGVYALRTSVEGHTVGVVFGMFAIAVALGSLLSSYFYGDEIADLIEHADADHRHALARYERLAAARPLARHAEKTVEARSIVDEYAHRGVAAQRAVEALKWRTLFGSPGVVGHGPAEAPTLPVGRVERPVPEYEAKRGETR